MNELNTGKAVVCVAYELEVIAKVKQVYGKQGDKSASEAFRRMAEECVAGVRLTAASLKEVEARRKANYDRRMKAREAKRGK